MIWMELFITEMDSLRRNVSKMSSKEFETSNDYLLRISRTTLGLAIVFYLCLRIASPEPLNCDEIYDRNNEFGTCSSGDLVRVYVEEVDALDFGPSAVCAIEDTEIREENNDVKMYKFGIQEVEFTSIDEFGEIRKIRMGRMPFYNGRKVIPEC